jgi:hypothetical protein
MLLVQVMNLVQHMGCLESGAIKYSCAAVNSTPHSTILLPSHPYSQGASLIMAAHLEQDQSYKAIMVNL